jgi:hypothetical protein
MRCSQNSYWFWMVAWYEGRNASEPFVKQICACGWFVNNLRMLNTQCTVCIILKSATACLPLTGCSNVNHKIVTMSSTSTPRNWFYLVNFRKYFEHCFQKCLFRAECLYIYIYTHTHTLRIYRYCLLINFFIYCEKCPILFSKFGLSNHTENYDICEYSLHVY